MTESMTEAREGRLKILLALYPLYKEEVYRRREQMMRITAFGCAFLQVVLLLSLWAPITPPENILVFSSMAGLVTFSSLLFYLILQQRDRHRMAKQSLIEIERALGLYEEGLYVDYQALYPQEWQTAWLKDHSSTLYIGFITLLTVLDLISLYFRSQN